MTKPMIRGDGVAAACCAHLLQQAGIPSVWDKVDRPRLPAIMLSGPALALIGDVFGPLERFAELHRIRRRVVAWGPDATPVAMDHAAVVVSEQVLLETLASASPVNFVPQRSLASLQGPEQGPEAGWEIFTSHPLPPQTEEHHFGDRRAIAVSVLLRDRVYSNTCWIESVDAGWLFLIPNGPHSGYLLAVGGDPEELLDRSRLVAERIEHLESIAGNFPAHPRLRWPLCGSGDGGAGWLACGSAAMAFDPLCGDGTAQAIREAILAAAVVQASAKGRDRDQLLTHYQARMAAGLARHLKLCEEFYRKGHPGFWWESEFLSTRKGTDWCARRVQELAGFRFQLNGLELQPLDASAA